MHQSGQPGESEQRGDSFRGEVQFGRWRLWSVFQPILGLNHSRVIGYEGLLRGRDTAGREIPPTALFAEASRFGDLAALDRQAQALHMASFFRQGTIADSWLFLNVNAGTIATGEVFGGHLVRLLEGVELSGDRVVIEVLEDAFTDEVLLAEVVAYCRELGCLVALDDFGAGHSNFDRIWRLTPDIIKLDRSVIVQAARHRGGKLRRLLPDLVALMHQAGSLVLVEGVENDEEALIALDANADLAQGFHLGRPAPVASADDGVRTLDRLRRHFTDFTLRELSSRRDALSPIVTAFREAADRIVGGVGVADACGGLLNMRGVDRCYLLNDRGEQIATHLSAVDGEATKPRFAPLNDTSGGSWFSRHYFRAALDEPGRLKITQPYLSNSSARMCITLSVASEHARALRVFCCDLLC